MEVSFHDLLKPETREREVSSEQAFYHFNFLEERGSTDRERPPDAPAAQRSTTDATVGTFFPWMTGVVLAI